MGIQCDVQYVFSFTYQAKLEQNISEHEFDHVFLGFSNDVPQPDVKEVGEYKYMSLEEIEVQLAQNPKQFTAWFLLIFERVKKELSKLNQEV